MEITEMTVISEMDGPSQIIDVLVEADGLWVLSPFEPFVWRYSPEGERIGSFGIEGGGPSELQMPVLLVPLPDGTEGAVGVLDELARTVKVFDEVGELRGAIAVEPPPNGGTADIRRWSAVQPERTRLAGDRWIREVNEGFTGDHRGLWEARVAIIAADGTEEATVIEFSPLRPDHAILQEGQVQGPMLFTSYPRWDLCPSGDIALLTPADSTLRRVSITGESLSEVPVSLDVGPMGTEEFTAFFRSIAQNADGVDIPRDAIEASVAPLVAQLVEFHSGVAPPANLLCDPSDRVWVEKLALDEDWRGYGRTWQVFDGESVMTIHFPEGFQAMHLAADRIVGIHTDELGVMSLAWTPPLR